MATAQENLARFQEIADRGIQDKLDGDKRARFDEAVKRGLINVGKSESSSAPIQMSSAGGGIPGQFPETKDMRTRATNELPELFKSGILNGEDPKRVAQFSAIAAVTPNEAELGKIATTLFPNIGMQEDEKGNILLGNNKTGVRAVINTPGPSLTDAAQLAGLGSLYSPAGRVAAPLRAALASGGVQTGIEASQALSGGEFNPEDVAASTVLGGAATQAPRLAEKLAKAAKTPASDANQAILKAGEETGIPVLTTDVRPPQTIAGGLARQFGERIPFIGTGGMRGAQQKAREAFTKTFAESVPPVNDEAIITSLKNRKEQIKTAAGNRYQRITQQMDALGNVPLNNTISKIDDAISELSKKGTIPDSGTINDLTALKEALSEPQNFSLLKENRTYLSDLINRADPSGRSQLPTRSKALLSKIKSAITEDMDEFIKKNDSVSFDKYKQADRIYADEANKLTKSRLKNVLDKGDITPEQYRNLMFSSKPSEQRILYQSLNNQGRSNARIAVLDEIVQKAGGLDNISPQTLNRELKRRSSQIDIFFKGQQKEQLKGFQRVLEATERAKTAGAVSPTGQSLQAPLYVAAGAGAALQNPIAITGLILSGTTGLGARIYESKPVRTLMIKLANVPRNSAMEAKLLSDLSSAVNSAAQAYTQQSTSEKASNF